MKAPRKTRLLNPVAGAAAVVTVAGSLAIQTVGGFEGLKLYAYRDVIGVWTACYGETKGIKPGMKFSKEDCNNMLVESLVEHEQGMRKCLRDPDGLPIKVYIADLSLTYNIGPGAFCRSTLVRRQNAGDVRGSCNEYPKFNKAGKPPREVRGLTFRRAKERQLCMEG